ncbi:ABC transporter [Legionella rubrilucens]|uniref:ABC transporter n=1 Tax=Legionella rubrilucens TaxID=458 RepID=A0A0W0XPM0_9GAMM|nr:peptidase domain-containing ABC transporter [Legionella rubrilucens]KTD46637.1 ABC transporter [Legionella rubrilucens]
MNSKQLNFKWQLRTALPVIFQDETAECGHACVAMVSNYHGHELNLPALRALSKPSSRGTTLLDITRLLTRLGFRTRALRVPLEELHFIQCPAILHWDLNHFVVLKQVKKGHVIIHDPVSGVKKCKMEELSKSFTGIALEIEKEADFKTIRNNQSLTLTHLASSIHGVKKFITLLLFFSAFIELFNLINPLFMQFVTDNIISTHNAHNLYFIAFGFALLVFMQTVAEYIRGHVVIYVGNHLTEQFSSNIVRHILKLPLDFFEKRHKGDVQSRFQSIEDIQQKISTDFINTLFDGLMIAINLTVMVFYSIQLTGIVLVALALYVLFRQTSYHFLKKQTETSIAQHAKASSAFLETLHGILPIKAFLKEQTQFNTWRNAFIASLNADIRIARVNLIYRILNQFLFHIEHIIVVCAGASLVLANQFSLGMLMAFLAYRLSLVNKASTFIQSWFDYRLIALQLHRLSDIVFQEPEEISRGKGELEHIKGSLRMQEVSFRYNPEGEDVISHLNLDIKAGEKVVITGASGCGKSTFLKVAMGLLNKTQGEIFIDGKPLHEFGIHNLRQISASVMQDDVLLSGSILNNIAFFDEAMDLERVHESAKLACIHEEIEEFPMGYETLVGDMGSTLSGGQKQRILLARALYKQPKILFLDEATSHLDIENERRINQSLNQLAITQVVIAHRPETIKMADRVIHLQGKKSLQPFFPLEVKEWQPG